MKSTMVVKSSLMVVLLLVLLQSSVAFSNYSSNKFCFSFNNNYTSEVGNYSIQSRDSSFVYQVNGSGYNNGSLFFSGGQTFSNNFLYDTSSLGANGTYSFWIKYYSANSSTQMNIFGMYNTSCTSSLCYRSQFFYAPVSGFYFSDYSSGVQVNSTVNAIDENAWQHIILSYNGSNAYVYVNGTLNGTYTGTWPLRTGVLRLGSNGISSTDRLNGYVDELCGWNITFNSSDASSLFSDTDFFIPPDYLNLSIGGFLSNVDVEDGSTLNISANSTNSSANICLWADHGEVAMQCGSGSKSILWNASTNIRKFNDSSSYSNVTFNSSLSYFNFTLYPIKNASVVSFAKVLVAGNNLGTSDSYTLHEVENSTVCDGSFDPAQPCLNANDSSYATWAAADVGAYANITLNYTPTIGSPGAASLFQFKGIGISLQNFTLSTYGCQVSPYAAFKLLAYQGGMSSGTSNLTCWTGSSWTQLAYQGVSLGGMYESAMYWLTAGLPNYSRNVKLDFGADNSTDLSVWGDLKESTSVATLFNDSSSVATVSFSSRSTSPVYVRVAKLFNVSAASFLVSGGLNNYSQIDTYLVAKDSVGRNYKIYSPSAEYYQTTGKIYLFGGKNLNSAQYACYGKSQYNCSVVYNINGGYGSVNLLNDTPYNMGAGGCAIQYYDGIYLFGGYDDSSYYNKTYFYNITNGTYSTKLDMPEKLAFMDCVKRNDAAYIFGGYNGTSYPNTTMIYNFTTNVWSWGANFSIGTIEGLAENINSTHILVFGGSYGPSYASSGKSWIYNVTGNSWVQGPTISGVFEMSGALIGGSIFAYGGSYDTYDNYSRYIYKFNSSVPSWDLINKTFSNYTSAYNDCVEVDNHSVCVGSCYFGFDWCQHSIYHLPNSVSVQVGSFPNISANFSGDMTATTRTATITSALNTQLQTCVPNSDKYCDIPVYLGNRGSGYINASSLSVTQTLGIANMGGYNVSCSTDNCSVNIQVYGGSYGGVNLSNLSIQYLGSGVVQWTANDSLGNVGYANASIYYSAFNYSLPNNTQYLEFISSTPTAKNVTPYGQLNSTPFLNVTMLNVYGKNSSWSALVAGNDTCVNLTFGNSNNKSNAVLMTNNTWQSFTTNVSSGTNFGVWMWADYGCNQSAWRTWVPSIYFRGCCQSCICDSSTS